MRCILVLVFLFITSGKALADESITIFVKETSYSINTSDEELNSAELESKLKQLKFSLVTLDVDYCADPVMVAEVYVALANANPSVSVKDVHLIVSGSHEQSKCKNA
ncbi:hypothetical protein [Shewanella acanthi]|uniref:hypothetical protein n=1 Tax=Shewanella acanthi TaxID=2864212 RepID=UPI001C656AB9|nr:hypothetical protein [Shewanella acanthi]QYJ77507.1 hypothetical protein K0H61_10110 [Shewanella acanthi]